MRSVRSLSGVFLLLTALLAGGGPRLAAASESLRFGPVAGDDSQGLRAVRMLEDAAPEAVALNGALVRVARVELNGDARSELVVRVDFSGPACTERCRSLFFVFVDRDGLMRLVARLGAFDLRVSDSVNGGVRGLMVYDDPGNDYAWAPYVWEPTARRYVPEVVDSRALSGKASSDGEPSREAQP